MRLNTSSLVRDLKKRGTMRRAKASAWFFKTAKGQYGYGDVFFGVSVPEQRKIAKKYSQLALPEIGELLKNKVHECRLTALIILAEQYRKADKKQQESIAQFYIKHVTDVNNWDLVDTSAPRILGQHLKDKNRAVLYKFARSTNLWTRRVAIITTLAFIKEDQYQDTLKISKILLDDKHDLIHKAVGWMLREVGNRNLAAEMSFLNKYSTKMPRTALRYAIEKFPKSRKLFYLRRT